jgi:uncharacterized Zn finger protein
MEPLDGNAIAGELFAHYGAEMTSVIGTCGHCGAHGPVAELRVFARAPGTVARCPACGKVVMVLTRAEIHLERFTLSEGTIASQ